jgi:hypothetical protein
MGFKSEKELFSTAMASSPIQHLANMFDKTAVLVEPTGLFGIPDLVIASLDSSLDEQPIIAFAFEMKLSNWKRALMQAFRYRAFAETAYVLLDRKHIAPALKQIEKFERANIGLLSIDLSGTLIIHHQPINDVPFCERTRAHFEKIVVEATTDTNEDYLSSRLNQVAYANMECRCA